MDINSGSPWNFSAPNVNMTGAGGMFPQAQSMVRGGGYPGGPSFGMAPQMNAQQIAMQNAMFGQKAARANMGFNMGLANQNLKYHMATDVTPFSILASGVGGAQAFTSGQANQIDPNSAYGGGQPGYGGSFNPYGVYGSGGVGNAYSDNLALPRQPSSMSLPNY